MKRLTLKQLTPLLALLALALFPFGSVVHHWPWLDRLISPDSVHVIGHLGIFIAIGAALLLAAPGLLRRPWLYLGLMLLAGVAQEAIQLAYKRRPVAYDDLRDLAVDMLGALIIYGLLWALRQPHLGPRRRQAP